MTPQVDKTRPQEVKRKLAAILSADVKGYSRLMGEDEKGTVRTLNTYKELMTGLIQHHRGRVVDAPGDNVLAEFSSVVDAVECAVKIQKGLKTRNAELPENRRMEFRIGVNLGDVIEDGEQILGDGVNIAARLESLSDAGGVCISGTAFDQVRNKLELGYEYLGEQTVKNIALPVRVYKVMMEPEAAGKLIGEKKAKSKQWQRAAIGLVVVVIVMVVAIVIWRFYSPTPPKTELASKEKMAFPLPDKPSIAVLPFTNMSEDPKQEFFSDGITEDIITALSRVPQLFVIARNSTFTYKGKNVKVQQVAEELGIQYVLEGSVQRSGQRLRITAQLVDAIKGHHLLSERYDKEMKEVFALQDELTKKIVVAVQVKLTEGVGARMQAKGTTNLEAYLMVLEARELLLRFNKDDNALARRKCEEAVSIDPEYPRAHAILSTIYVMDMMFGVFPKESMEKALKAAQKAVAIDDTNTSGHIALEFVYSWQRRHDEAIRESERAVELEPGSAATWFSFGRALDYACRHQGAIESFKKSIRMNPFPQTAVFFHLGNAYLNIGKYEEAIAEYKKAIKLSPTNAVAYKGLAVSYAHLGHIKEARAALQEALKLDPKFSMQRYPEMAPWKEQTTTERWMDGFRKAGLK
jgi:adenylate cyclase